jgi:hypothetical protein
MMVAAGGAISLRFSKVVGGGLSTVISTAIGVTYVANTFYNLRVQLYWSNALQANVMQSKLWAVGGTEPGGWMVSTTDAGLTQYTAGTGAGVMARDEATVIGAVTAKIKNVVTMTYGLPVPASTDTMCADPAHPYPKQAALESLADAADVVATALDPFAAIAEQWPRVRVSRSNFVVNSFVNISPAFTTTEFNIGTDTNLGYDNSQLSLPSGMWLVTFEVQLAPATVLDYWSIEVQGGSPNLFGETHMRTQLTLPNLEGQGGSGHASALIISPDPAASVSVGGFIGPNTATNYTVKYAALSAIKISDYFA